VGPLLPLRLFGTENLFTFDPLMKLIQDNVDVDALAASGRPVRVGSASFWDGTYREIGPTAQFPNNDRKYFLQYVYASALIPVVGKMPRIQQSDQDTDPRHWLQFGDGGLLHDTAILLTSISVRPEKPRRATSNAGTGCAPARRLRKTSSNCL
jgi:hypothetical protein